MNPVEISITLLTADGESHPLMLRLGAGGLVKTLTTTANALVASGTFSGSDYFDSLAALREHLQASQLQALCAGARIDAYPSGMSREMSAGRKVYIHTPGEPAGQPQDIFAPAPADKIATVAEQQAYHQQWVESLGDK